MLSQIFVAVAFTVVGIQAQTPNLPNPVQLFPGINSKQCLSATNYNGAPVGLYPCGDFDDQKWTFKAGQVQLYGNKCLDIIDGKTANGTQLQIWDCATGNTNQAFVYTQDKRLTWKDHKMCIDVKDGNTEDGALLQLWTCVTGNTNQVINARSA